MLSRYVDNNLSNRCICMYVYMYRIAGDIGVFKFGGMVRYCHTHMHVVERLADSNLTVKGIPLNKFSS